MAEKGIPSAKIIGRLIADGMTKRDAERMITRQLNEGSASLTIEGDLLGRWARQLKTAAETGVLDTHLLVQGHLYGHPDRTIRVVGFRFPEPPRAKGGRPEEHDWNGAHAHVRRHVAEHGPLANKQRVAELMAEWFVKNEGSAPDNSNIRKQITDKSLYRSPK